MAHAKGGTGGRGGERDILRAGQRTTGVTMSSVIWVGALFASVYQANASQANAFRAQLNHNAVVNTHDH